MPEGVTLEQISQLCEEQTGTALKAVAYCHASGWKRAGAYRLFVETERGQQWRIIFKNAIYDLDHIPALKNFPLSPGLAEYLVYRDAGGALSEYLPRVFSCTEVLPGKHYQYLLEDLGENFTKLSEKASRKIKLGVTRQLPAFHEALKEWMKDTDSEQLLKYNKAFSEQLCVYAEDILSRFSNDTSNQQLAEVCELWPRISELYRDSEFQDSRRDMPIHGDANGSNILIHNNDSSRIKFIDWEWAGLGVIYSDLVSLFRRADSLTHSKVMAAYTEGGGDRITGSLARLYKWCRLERGLIDASYIMAQCMDSPELFRRRQAWGPNFIKKSFATMLSAYKELAG